MMQRGSAHVFTGTGMGDRSADAPSAPPRLQWRLHGSANETTPLSAAETPGFWNELFEMLDAYVETMRGARERIAALEEALDERDARIEQLMNTCEALRQAFELEEEAQIESEIGTPHPGEPPPKPNGSGTWQILQNLEGRRRPDAQERA